MSTKAPVIRIDTGDITVDAKDVQEITNQQKTILADISNDVYEGSFMIRQGTHLVKWCFVKEVH